MHGQTCAQLLVGRVETLGRLVTSEAVMTLSVRAELLLLILPAPTVRAAITHLGGTETLAWR